MIWGYKPPFIFPIGFKSLGPGRNIFQKVDLAESVKRNKAEGIGNLCREYRNGCVTRSRIFHG